MKADKLYACLHRGFRAFLRPAVLTAAWCLLMLCFHQTLHAQLYADSAALSRISSPGDLTAFLEKAYQKALDRGMPNFVPYSLFLIQQSQKALQQRTYDHAAIYADYAQKFSPDIPVVYVARAKAHWSNNRLLINRLAAGYLQALLKKTQGKNIDDLCFFLFSNLAVIIGATLLTLAVFSCLSLIRYFGLAAHDLRHIIMRHVPDPVVYGMAVGVFLLPVLLGCSLFLSCIFWLMLLYTYHTRRERLAIIGLIGSCGILLPVLVLLLSFAVFMPQSEPVRLLWKANYGYWNQQDIEDLERLGSALPQDREILLSLGIVNKKEGNYRTAQKYYEKLLTLNPRDYRARTNLGNIHLATHNWDAAVAQYEEAIAAQPALSAAAHFNLARAYQQKFMFKEADGELEAAKRINRSTVDRYLKIYSENYNRMLIDEVLPVRNLWARGYHLFMQDTRQVGSAWDLLFMGIPFPYAVPVILLVFCCSALAARAERLRLATQCHMCGKPLCKRCQRVVTAEIICSQCMNFVKKQDTLGFKLKEEKVSEIKKHLKKEKLIGSVLSWLVPGAAHIWKGRPVKGSVYLFLFLVLLCKALALLLLESPWEFIDSFAYGELGAVLLLGALMWLLLTGSALHIKSRHLETNVLLKNIALDI